MNSNRKKMYIHLVIWIFRIIFANVDNYYKKKRDKHNRNMAKQVIRLNENELKEIIYEGVKSAFEKSNNRVMIDISDIDIDILRNAYHDLRLTPTITVFGDRLSNIPSINEVVGDVLPPDIVVNSLIKKYRLPSQLVCKIEAYNKIYIYVVTALIGNNDKLIEQDMQKMGYFLGYRQPPQTINGMTFQVLQFEV